MFATQITKCGDLPHFLRGLREGRGVSKQTLAARAGLDRSTLLRWESGAYRPRLPEMDALLTALGATAEERAAARGFLTGAQVARGASAAPTADPLVTLSPEARPPVGGDLLRALRLRQGWTQAEAARRAGVTQATLNRWENGDSWPDPARLHTLCAALGAHPDEAVALSRGRFSLEPAVPEFLREQFRGDLGDPYAAMGWFGNFVTARDGTFQPDLEDLRYLSLESWLWAEYRAGGGDDARRLLAFVYARHGEVKANRGHFAEAEKKAHVALRLMDGDLSDNGPAIRLPALLTLTEREVYTEGLPMADRRRLSLGTIFAPAPAPATSRHRRGLRRLADWSGETDLARFPAPSQRAWLLAHAARYCAGAGDWSGAVAFAERAVATLDPAVAPNFTVDRRLRTHLLARLLLRAGRPQEVIRVLAPDPLGAGDVAPPEWLLEEALLRAAAARATGDARRVNREREEAERYAARADAPILRADLETLRAYS
jgi:transcriptional regulator with XRE-family HTH domain